MSAPELSRVYERLATAGAAAWPSLACDPAVFVSFLRARSAGLEPERVEALPAADLFLVCCCVHATPGAAETFSKEFLTQVPQTLGRMHIAAAVAQEVPGRLFERLFAPHRDEPEGALRISDYVGTGPLRNWLNVAAMREALMMLRKSSRDAEGPTNAVPLVPAVEEDPELRYLHARYKLELEASFKDAAEILSPRERNLLRHKFLDGLSIDEIGRLYRVHRATAARWVDAAQIRLAAETRTRMMDRLRLPRHDVESILRLVRSRFDIAVRSHFTD